MQTNPNHQVIHDSPPPDDDTDPHLLRQGDRVLYRSTIVASSYVGGVDPAGQEHDWWVLLVLRPFAPYFAVLTVDPETDTLVDWSDPYENIGHAVLAYVERGGESPVIEDMQRRADAPPVKLHLSEAAPTSSGGSRLALGMALGIAMGGGG